MALSNVIQTVPDTPLPPSRGDLRGVIPVWNLTLQKLLNAIGSKGFTPSKPNL